MFFLVSSIFHAMRNITLYSVPICRVFFFHSSIRLIVPKFQINLTSLLGRIHLFGEYIHMAFNVTKTLLKILMSFIPTFIAFTLTFNILMQSSEVFQSIHNTGFKVFVMMLGEFELTDYFTTQEVSKVGGRNFSVQILFVLFVIFICVIVMNLLIGLTVSNIDDLKKDADIILASSQIDDIVDMKRKLDYPCIKYMFKIKYFERLRPEELIEKFPTQEKKVIFLYIL